MSKILLENRYEIEGIAGRGGTSIVYKAYDIQAEHAVRAIKEISKTNIALYEMAKLESKLIKELYERDKSNVFFPNIIHTFESRDKFYIVQDFLDGECMEEMLKAGPMPYKMVIDAAKQICSFMQFFHSTGRIYSDMKPENIMVLKPSATLMDNSRSPSSVKLKFIDFGTAIRGESGSTGYTPEYAAPEQPKETALDERTDIFNIGATMYHMIQGRKPMKVSNGTRFLSSAERFKFDKNVNGELKRIIMKCVSDDPSKRYKSCDALYKELCRTEKHSYLRYILISLAMTVVSFSLCGFAAYKAESLKEKNNSNNYSIYVNTGNYAEAIKIDHTNRDDIYSKLITSFTEDERLDPDEDNFIINEIKSRGSISPGDDNYGRCMYEIGNAYWLYYYPYEDAKLNDLELEKSRMNESYEWFGNALNDEDFRDSMPDAYNRAVIFHHIGDFYAQIDRKEREGTDDREFYGDMWENIVKLSDYIDDNNEVVSARVCQTLLSLVSRYSAKFRQNGVDRPEQDDILSRIREKVYDKSGGIVYLNNYSISIASNFDVDAVKLKLDMAYADQ